MYQDSCTLTVAHLVHQGCIVKTVLQAVQASKHFNHVREVVFQRISQGKPALARLDVIIHAVVYKAVLARLDVIITSVVGKRW